MAGNGKAPVPFQAPAGTPIVGQPFTLTGIGVPVNATLTCNCGGADTAVAVAGSVAAACPSCGRVFNFAFNPTTMKLEVFIGVPPKPPEGVPS